MSIQDGDRPVPGKAATDPEGLPAFVREALARLRFGSIQLTVHEGKLVQVDITEKTRLPA